MNKSTLQKSYWRTLKDSFNKPVRKLNTFSMWLSTMILVTCPTLCAPPSLTMDQLYDNIIGFLCTLARYVGGVLLAYGIWQLIMAIREQNGEQQTRAITFAFSGVALIGLKSLLQMVGVI